MKPVLDLGSYICSMFMAPVCWLFGHRYRYLIDRSQIQYSWCARCYLVHHPLYPYIIRARKRWSL